MGTLHVKIGPSLAKKLSQARLRRNYNDSPFNFAIGGKFSRHVANKFLKMLLHLLLICLGHQSQSNRVHFECPGRLPHRRGAQNKAEEQEYRCDGERAARLFSTHRMSCGVAIIQTKCSCKRKPSGLSCTTLNGTAALQPPLMRLI